MQSLGNIQQKATAILIGKPGVGKSTLLNCLLSKVVFKSGILFGCSSLTQELQTYSSSDGNHYIDTPGITTEDYYVVSQALKQGGEFKIFFVISLDGLTVRQKDIETIKLILDSTPQIGSKYAIIINKVPPQLIQNEMSRMSVISQLNILLNSNVLVYCNARSAALEDGENCISPLEAQLLNFFNNTPQVVIHPEYIDDIGTNGLEQQQQHEDAEQEKQPAWTEGLMEQFPIFKAHCTTLLSNALQIKSECIAAKSQITQMMETCKAAIDLLDAQHANFLHQQKIEFLQAQIESHQEITFWRSKHEAVAEQMAYEKQRSTSLEKRIIEHNSIVTKQKNILWWLVFFAILVLGIILCKPDNNLSSSKLASPNYINVVFEGDVDPLAPNIKSWIVCALQHEFHNETVRIENNQTSVSGSVVIFLKIAHTRINEDMTCEDDEKIRKFTEDACVVSIILVDKTEVPQRYIYGSYEKQNAHNLENEVYILQRPYYKDDFDLHSINKRVIANMVSRIKKHNCTN